MRSLLVCLGVLLAAVTADASEVTLVRDARGVAHVFAKNSQGAMFGAGWASAEDRLLQMHWTRRAAQGRLAELVGLVAGSDETTVEHDERMRRTGLYRHEVEVADTLNKRTRKLLQAYCDGVNAYLAQHGDVLPAPLAGEVVEPWTIPDCLAVWDRLASLFQPFPGDEGKNLHDLQDALVRFDGDLVAAAADVAPLRVLDDAAAAVKQDDVSKKRQKKIAKYAAKHVPVAPEAPVSGEFPKMSHAWAVGKSRSTTKRGCLESDPQTKVALPSIWYEIRLHGGSIDARGIGVAGCPALLIGWNRRVAWGVTALGADQSDLFLLDTEDEPSGSYRLDGESVPFETTDDTILVKDGDPVDIVLRESAFGPLVTGFVPDRKPGEEYALSAIPERDVDGHTVEGALAMLRAHSVTGLRKAVKGWRAPGVHLVAADRKGHVMYQMLAGIPLRSGVSPLAGWAAQDGSTCAAAWLEDVPFKLLPWVRDPADGVVFSANHMPVGSWYPIPLRVATGGTGDTSRSWRLRELLVEDAPELMTPEQVAAVHDDVVNPWRREIVHIGLAMREAGETLSDDALAALTELEPWYAAGARSLVGEPGYVVADHLGTKFRDEDAPELVLLYGDGGPGLSFFLKSVAARLEDDPDAPFEPAEVAWIDVSLATANVLCEFLYGDLPSTWDASFAAAEGSVTLGYGATLEGFGGLDDALSQTFEGLLVPDGGVLAAQRTQSYSQFVDFDELDGSRALLPPGVSGVPGDAHALDQSEAWLGRTLLPAALAKQKEMLAVAAPDDVETIVSD
ncbi:MAG: penicillin acylase family protein [Planctomycetes bacterium]|nr:penicillin acylase family protein [Planctomycetota bacterium]